MQSAINTIFFNNHYKTQARQTRAYFILSATLVLMVFFTVYSATVRQLYLDEQTIFETLFSDPFSLPAVLSIYGGGLLTFVLLRLGWLDWAGAGPVLMWFGGGVLLAVRNGMFQPSDGFSIALLVAMGVMFLPRYGLLISLPVALISLVLGIQRWDLVRETTADPFSSSTDGTLLTLLLMTVGLAVFLLTYRSTIVTERDESRVIADSTRLSLANLTTQIARRISSRLNLNDLLNGTVEDIRTTYPSIYHAQIFLIDDKRRDANLVASTGDVGKLLLRRQHSLAVGSVSVIGRVTSSGEPVIARAGSSDSVHRRNEFLPDTVVEAAFPLVIDDRVIGALDLQSVYDDAFQTQDVPVFQSLADSIALAIDNARLFDQSQARLEENRRLVEQMRVAMRQVETLNRQITTEAWDGYIADRRPNTNIDIDFEKRLTRPGTAWTPALTDAVRQNRLIQRSTLDGAVVALPLRVRGQVIGAVEFEVAEPLPTEDIAFLQEVGERFSLAVESARLYDESRQSAERQIMMNTVNSSIQRSNGVDAVLEAAARSLKETLGAGRVSIRLGTPTPVAPIHGSTPEEG